MSTDRHVDRHGDAYSRGAGAMDALLRYFHPLFKAVGIAVMVLAAGWALLLVITLIVQILFGAP